MSSSSSPNIITCGTTFQWFSLVSVPIHPDAVMQIEANNDSKFAHKIPLPISVNIIQFSEYVIKGLFIRPLFLIIFKLFVIYTCHSLEVSLTHKSTLTHTSYSNHLLFFTHPPTTTLASIYSFVPCVFLFQNFTTKCDTFLDNKQITQKPLLPQHSIKYCMYIVHIETEKGRECMRESEGKAFY